MKRRCIAAALVMSFIVPLSVTAQDSATKQMAARTEVYSIPSLTLSDEQFLKGDAGGKPVVRLNGRAREEAEKLGIREIDVSLSHSREYAVAVAIGTT